MTFNPNIYRTKYGIITLEAFSLFASILGTNARFTTE